MHAPWEAHPEAQGDSPAKGAQGRGGELFPGFIKTLSQTHTRTLIDRDRTHPHLLTQTHMATHTQDYSDLPMSTPQGHPHTYSPSRDSIASKAALHSSLSPRPGVPMPSLFQIVRHGVSSLGSPPLLHTAPEATCLLQVSVPTGDRGMQKRAKVSDRKPMVGEEKQPERLKRRLSLKQRQELR